MEGPTGGVSRPITRLKTTMEPNWIGSMHDADRIVTDSAVQEDNNFTDLALRDQPGERTAAEIRKRITALVRPAAFRMPITSRPSFLINPADADP